MRFHAPLCVLPPCTSSLLWAGRIRGLTLSPVSLCSLPASSCTHLDRPHDLSFRLSSPPDADGHSSFYPAASALCPRPASIRLPVTGLLYRTLHPPVAIRRDKRTSGCPGTSYAQPEVGPPLPCLPDLLLPVEHTHIAVPCHFASSPSRLPPIKRRGRKAGASLPPVSAAVTAHHKSCPRCT